MAMTFATDVGKFTITDVLLEHDGPQVFACTSADGRPYLCSHAAWDGRESVWILTRISPSRLQRVSDGLMTLREAYVHNPLGWILIARGGPDVTVDAVTKVPLAQVPADYLPRVGVRLCDPPDDRPPVRARIVGRVRRWPKQASRVAPSTSAGIREAAPAKYASTAIRRITKD